MKMIAAVCLAAVLAAGMGACTETPKGNAPAANGSAPTPPVAVSPAKAEVAWTYGEALKMDDKDSITAATVLADPAAYAKKDVRVKGKVAAVCEKKGCWFTVTGGGKTEQVILLKFQDPPEGRLVPMEAIGHDAVIEGTLVVGKISEAFARDLASDQGKSDEEIQKIKGPQPVVTLKNPAVKIIGIAPAKAAT